VYGGRQLGNLLTKKTFCTMYFLLLVFGFRKEKKGNVTNVISRVSRQSLIKGKNLKDE
jgi:hypothetical protein